jgi:hypothetical protein
MADKLITMLCVHGLGDHRTSDWETSWAAAVDAAFPKIPGLRPVFKFVTYDDIFAEIDITPLDCAAALWKLGTSGLFGPARARGVLTDIAERIKWTAGYVVAWVEREDFQRQSRKRILDAVAQYQPDVILAHSLGSLVTYDAFSHDDAAKASVSGILQKATYVTLGSQIGNPFVIRNLTPGRIAPLPVKQWHHLYNIHDSVFTAEIRIWDATNFTQTNTPFDIDGIADHAPESYFGHQGTIQNVWRSIAAGAKNAKAFGPAARIPRTVRPATTVKKRQKALLVGINDYPDPANRLEGCVNDVFTMSKVLQSCGLPPETIRVCLDDRATAQGIIDRLKWLLDDPKPGDELVFYYSGHGARIPEYGENFEPDRHVETLVAHDFDWTMEKAVTDDQIYELYSQLPYETRLIMIFDCCHSGGIHRDSGPRPRGINPPDDIRHRELKWDPETDMWVRRDFRPINKEFTTAKEKAELYFGKDGATSRIGRAGMLRGLTQSQHNRLKQRAGTSEPYGPYLPMIIEACAEEEFSYEYRDGATSHGAFTYSLAKILDRQRQQGRSVTFSQLVDKTRDQLQYLQFAQVPQLLGPTKFLDAKVPWTLANRTQPGRRTVRA